MVSMAFLSTPRFISKADVHIIAIHEAIGIVKMNIIHKMKFLTENPGNSSLVDFLLPLLRVLGGC